jgi:hypothetical protein
MGTLALLSACLLAAPPLTLDDALAAATKRNAELALARLDRETAAVDVRQSYQGVLPRLDLSGGFGRLFVGETEEVTVVSNPTPPPDFVRSAVSVPASDFGDYRYNLALSWTLFDGLASWNLIPTLIVTANNPSKIDYIQRHPGICRFILITLIQIRIWLSPHPYCIVYYGTRPHPGEQACRLERYPTIEKCVVRKELITLNPIELNF